MTGQMPILSRVTELPLAASSELPRKVKLGLLPSFPSFYERRKSHASKKKEHSLDLCDLRSHNKAALST